MRETVESIVGALALLLWFVILLVLLPVMA